MWGARRSTIMEPMSTTTNLLKRILGPVQQLPADTRSLTLRHAVPADADELEGLAQLDSRRAPRGVVLVAEVGGELWAAVSLDDMHAVADPFRPTGELVTLLFARARQLRRAENGRLQALPRVWPETGYDRAAVG
jgi:hypothetical protein